MHSILKFYGFILISVINLKEYEYLIKWDGWPLTSCSWEPSNHLTEELLR